MSSSTAELAERRRALLARSAALRERLAFDGRTLEASLSFVDRGVALARSGKLQPVFTLATLALMLLRPRLLRPRLLWTLATRGVALWPVARRVVPAVWQRLKAARTERRARASLTG
jgi:hypothetical protein